MANNGMRSLKWRCAGGLLADLCLAAPLAGQRVIKQEEDRLDWTMGHRQLINSQVVTRVRVSAALHVAYFIVLFKEITHCTKSKWGR